MRVQCGRLAASQIPKVPTLVLADIFPSDAIAHLSAINAASYAGTGQTWANTVAAPTDGSGQTVYDFTRGGSSSSSTDDPTFNGTAGDPSAYFSVDGTDYFRTANGTTTSAFLDDVARTDQETGYSFTIAFQLASLTATAQRLFGNGYNTSTIGIMLYVNQNGSVSFSQYNGSASSPIELLPAGTIVAGQDYLMTITVQKSATAGNRRIRIQLGNLSPVEFTPTFNTCTTGSPNDFRIGASGNTTGLLSNGSRIYEFLATKRFLSAEEIDYLHNMVQENYRGQRNFFF